MSRNTRNGTRSHKTVRVIGFSWLVIAIFSAAGCHRHLSEQFDPQVFTWTGEFKAPGSVHLRSMNGAVEVKPSADDSVHVTAAATWHRGNPRTDLQFKVASAGTDLTLCVLWSRGTCSTSQYSTRPTFWRNFIRVHSTDANVTLTVYVPTRVKVDVRTYNGNVRVEATAPVTAHTLNGSIRVATAVGPVDAETINGSVDVRMTTLGEAGPVRAVTINGTASAYLPGTFDADVSLSAVNGRVVTDFAMGSDTAGAGRKHLRGTLGAGGRLVEVRAMNGSVSLRKLNADGTVAGNN